MLQKDQTVLHNFAAAISFEWLETNGLGGWSGSTIIGCHTRRYHGLLVAATHPPTERAVLLSKLDETIICGNEQFELGTNNYGNVIHPSGYQYASTFTKNIFPEFIYEAHSIKLKKTVAMLHGENTVLLMYEVLEAAKPFILELLPLVAARYYHSLQHANELINREASFSNNIFSAKPYARLPEIFVMAEGLQYSAAPDWYYNFHYSQEKERGLEDTEDLFSYGKLSVELNAGQSIEFIISADNPAGRNAQTLFAKEELRRKALLQNNSSSELQKQLILAADQFIAKRDFAEKNEGATIIAGYHWFTDWSRDTMISLPGLTLSTGRYEDAKKILLAFAHSVNNGMLPNRFTDNDGLPEYNTADGTLWYFVAIYKYLQYTNNISFVLNELLPVLKNIINWHFKGTRYNIKVDEDGLLLAGEKGTQLTWMDAKVDDWVVTPRSGKAVEIQALWFNALKIFSYLLQLNQETVYAAEMEQAAAKTKLSFLQLFWNDADNCLYDCIDDEGNPLAAIRPNQIFAISLPFALIENEKANAVLQIVKDQLYTPVGLRSLSANDPAYQSVYTGNSWQRDGAYHQGTVWSWLLGPYIDTLIKLNGGAGKTEAQTVISNFIYHLNEAGIGTVSEIFDAEPPHHARGCIAQAWGVAELLRSMDQLNS